MNLYEFQELSKRTMPFNGNPQNDIEFENMLGNYALGLIGETIEMIEAYHTNLAVPGAVENLMKEIGDVTHYAVGIAAIFKLQLPTDFDYPQTEANVLMMEILINGKSVTEYTKKRVYHRHEDEPFMYQSLLDIFAALNKICKLFGYSYSEVMQMNIEKLKKRYPESFNTEDSKKRVDTVQ